VVQDRPGDLGGMPGEKKPCPIPGIASKCAPGMSVARAWPFASGRSSSVPWMARVRGGDAGERGPLFECHLPQIVVGRGLEVTSPRDGGLDVAADVGIEGQRGPVEDALGFHVCGDAPGWVTGGEPAIAVTCRRNSGPGRQVPGEGGCPATARGHAGRPVAHG
jgi:hypothetical protein